MTGALRTPFLAVLAVSIPLAVLAGEVFDAYDIDPDQVQNSIINVCQGGWYTFPISSALRELDGEQRAAVVHELAAFTKAYVKSAEFKKAYGQAYKNSKPKGFGLPSLDPEAMARKAAEKMQGKSTDNATALDKNPNGTLRKRLETFLEMSKDVDFDAPLDGRQFARPEDEARPSQWKMCYRAGREATMAARAEAEAWLEELNKGE